ncbi:MAG: recombination protein NinG [Patescibacteria group bacterium]|nr:recombination protein NinG [Patescibacteria group bacterium]
MKRTFGLNRYGKSEQSKAIRKLDAAVSKMVRERDEKLGCITSGRIGIPLDCGHFRRRECMSTRFHPLNVNGQAVKDNRFEGGRTFEYGLALDRRYGTGCALFLDKLSRSFEGAWSLDDMAFLTDAARKGARVYEQVYYSLRPHHRFDKIAGK